MNPSPPTRATPGRPRRREDAEILEAALHAFAMVGYDAMSVRALNAELGLSHETIGRRFGTKRQLYDAAFAHGLADLYVAMAAAGEGRAAPQDDVEELRETVRTFIVAAAARPDLGRLVNQEGLVASDRLDHLIRVGFADGTAVLVELLDRLTAAGTIHRTSARELFFLAQAGAAPFTMQPLSAAFDAVDGPLDAALHVERVTDLIVRGLLVRP